MSGETITGVYSAGIVLASNPVTMAGTAAITSPSGPGMEGASGTYWTINSAGKITATGTTAGSQGIALADGGAVTNAAGGVISAFDVGVSITGTGTLVNHGTITASQTTGAPGYSYSTTTHLLVPLNAGAILGGGGVSNASGAIISGYFEGVAVGSSGSVTNAGTISAGVPGVGFGIVLIAGGSVSNASGGTITAGRYAVLSLGSNAATVVNQGKIDSSAAIALDLFSGGIVSNLGGGISGATDGVVTGAGRASTVINQGVIAGTTSDGVGLFGGGYLSNAAVGTITGGIYGIAAGNGISTITNFGQVVGQTKAGVGIFTGGTVINSGTGGITGGSYGILSGNDAATVVNFAAIGAENVAGIGLLAGGSITNAASGAITGGRFGVAATGATTTLMNQGAITGNVFGAALYDGGYVSNSLHATMTGYYFGVRITGAGGSANNLGSISSSATFTGSYGFDAAGLDLAYGGTVTNGISGRITATWKGVEIGQQTTGVGGTVVNQGFIYASNANGSTGAAVWVHGPAAITNAASGTIAGGPFAIVAYYQTTVVNFGSIGGTEFAVDAVNPGYANLVVDEPGAVFSGIVSGGNTLGSSVSSTLELASGSAVGTLSALGSQFIDFAQVTIDTGARWNLTGIDTIGAGMTLTNSGTLTDAGTLSNGGSIAGEVRLAAGAALTNLSSGTINNPTATAIYSAGTGVAVTNAGSISGGGGFGIKLETGGSVTNQTGGRITDTQGRPVYITGGAGTVFNAGAIQTTVGTYTAVDLLDGGFVSNASTGTISSAFKKAVYISGAAGSVFNAGMISAPVNAAVGVAVYMKNGGTVTNTATGTIAANQAFGVQIIGAAGTVINAGSISGAAGAVQFTAGFANRLVADPGAVFTGQVKGGNAIGSTIVSTLEFASGASTGTLTGLGSQYINFAQTTVDSGASWILGGSNTLAAAATLTNFGTLTLNSATLSDAGALVNDGTIILDPSSVVAANLTGSGWVTIAAGSSLEVQGNIAIGETLALAGTGANLHLDNPVAMAGTIANFGTTETIDLKGIDPASVSYTSGKLIFTGGTIAVAIAAGNTIQAVTSADGAAVSVIPNPIPAGQWLTDVSGDFDDPSKWSGDAVPGNTTDASINFADQPLVIHDAGSDAVRSLTNTAGDFVMSGGTLTTPTLTNDSTMSWTGGSLVLNSGTGGTASLNNAAGATLGITPNGQRLSVTGTGIASFTNAGSVTVAGSAGVANIDAAFVTTGQVLVNQGTLSLNSGGSSNAFFLQTGTAGVLQFGAPSGQTTGGTFTLTGGTYGGVETVISGSTLDASAASGVFFNDLRLTASGALLLGGSNAQTNNALVQGGTAWANASGTSYLSGSGTFTVFGGASLSAGVQSGSGLTRLFGTGSIGGGFAVDGGRTVENDGFLTWSSGNITLGAGDAGAVTQSGTLSNAGGAILYVTAAGARLAAGAGGSGVLANAGVTAVYAGSGEVDVDVSVANSGFIQALSGVVSLNGGGTSNAGNLIVASGATLQFGAKAGTAGGATFTLSGGGLTAGSVVISGSTVNAAAASSLSMGTLQLAGSGALLLGANNGQTSGGFSQGPGSWQNASGTPFLSGSGTFLVFGGANLSAGVQSGAGVTRLFGTSVLGGSGFFLDGGRTLENDGWLNWSSGNLTLGSGDAGAVTHAGTLSNVSGATLFVTASGGRIADASGGVVNNAGVMAVYAGGGAIDVDAAMDNSGYIQALSGVLSLNGGGSSDAGHLIEGSDAVLQFGTAASGVGGTFAITGGFYNEAVTDVTGGMLDLSAASGVSFGQSLGLSGSGVVNLGNLFVEANAVGLGGGMLESNGILVVNGPAALGSGVLSGTGTAVLNGGGSIGGALQLDGGLTLQNSGTLVWSGGSIALGSGNPAAATQAGVLNNVSGAVLAIESNGTLSAPGSGTVFNAGTLEKVGGIGVTSVNAGVSNSGTIIAASGTLSFGQAVGGSGTFDVEGSARLDFASVVGSSSSIAFIGGGGTLAIDSLGTTFAGSVSGFALGDGIDLTGVQSGGGTTFNFNSGTLTVSDGTHSASVAMVGAYSNASFVLGSDGHGGTLVLHT